MNPKWNKIYFIKQKAKKLFKTGHCSYTYFCQTMYDKYGSMFS